MKKPADAKLSVLIPAYNAEAYIRPTLENLWSSLKNTKWGAIEIIVLDDGSKDKTANVAEQTKIGVPVKVIRQKNTGRLKARRNGIKSTSGDYVFLLDSRVYTQPGAFEYLVRQMNKDPNAIVWNGHIVMDRTGNPFARFWWSITFIAWRKYMKRPRLVHFGEKEFDHYPKGAGCFFAPREYLIDAYKNFKTSYKEDRYANDDTALLRQIAARSDIYIAPEFAFLYNSRSTIKAFINHTKHRGIVLIDGYFKPGTRFYAPLIIYLLAIPLYIVFVIINPVLLLALPAGLLITFMTALVLEVPLADAAALVYVMPLFAGFYTYGLYRGIIKKYQGAKVR